MADILIIEARFYADIADELRKGAEAVLSEAEVMADVATVPGVLEIPAALRFAVKGQDALSRCVYQGFITLGCVIRGKTSHHEHVARECMRGLTHFVIHDSIALGNGVLTCENREQAWDRARVDGGNKGGIAARAVLDMLALRRRLNERSK